MVNGMLNGLASSFVSQITGVQITLFIRIDTRCFQRPINACVTTTVASCCGVGGVDVGSSALTPPCARISCTGLLSSGKDT